MEARTITVIESSCQRKTTFNSEAETLAELKRDMRNEGINYTDMTFYEGLSRTELRDDNSILPKDVPYKGNITNNLVFMLSKKNKKIRSGATTGMTRSEMLNMFKKDEGLRNALAKVTPRNYTNCSNNLLTEIINKKLNKNNNTQVKEEKVVKANTEVKNTNINKDEEETPYQKIYNKLHEIEILLVKIYNENTIANTSNTNTNNENTKKVVTSKSVYSDDELDEMFEDFE